MIGPFLSRARHVFDKLKKMFGAAPEPPPERPQRPLGSAARRAVPRPGAGAQGAGGAPRPDSMNPSNRRRPRGAYAASESPQDDRDDFAHRAPARRDRQPNRPGEPTVSSSSSPGAPAVEVACPNCGEPMLAGWGTTCGKCRPGLVAPRTMFMMVAAGAPPAAVAAPATGLGLGLTLGWVLVIQSVDPEMRKALVDLEERYTVLSRAGAPGARYPGVVQFQDTFMSSGHAVIERPPTGDRNGAFTIRDRDNPGPSVNGTFVNSRKLDPGEVARLSDGDVIKIGATELLFKSLWLPPPAGGLA